MTDRRGARGAGATSSRRQRSSDRRPHSKRHDNNRRDDRPFLIALFGLLVVIGAMAVGPLRSLSAANDRVDELTRERNVLAEEVAELEEQRADLNDPDEQEVYAREQLGFVKPGEAPYVVLPDPQAPPRGSDPPAEETAPPTPSPWYERLVDALTSLFG